MTTSDSTNETIHTVMLTPDLSGDIAIPVFQGTEEECGRYLVAQGEIGDPENGAALPAFFDVSDYGDPQDWSKEGFLRSFTPEGQSFPSFYFYIR